MLFLLSGDSKEGRLLLNTVGKLGSWPVTNCTGVNPLLFIKQFLADTALAREIARQAYISAESSDRVKRALRHPIRTSEEMFSHKDKIFYKRDDSNRWRGPATVIGQDGKIVFVRHGSRLLRVAVCRCVKVKDSFGNNESIDASTSSNDDVQIDSNSDLISKSNGENSSIQIDSDSESELEFEND
jgi:hypothetical protein